MTLTDDPISAAIAEKPATQRARLDALRSLIHRVAAQTEAIAGLEESLKWGQPSFVARPRKLGSSVRIDTKGDGVSVYFICTTGLVERFRELYPDSFRFVGNRELHFAAGDAVPEPELAHCIAMALTYHKSKRDW